MNRPGLCAALLLALCLSPVPSLHAEESALRPPIPPAYLRYEGTAYDRDSAAVLYRESHYVEYAGERVVERLVLYRCPDGAPFARKRVAGEFGTPWLPDFEMVDQRLGYREGLDGDREQLSVFVQEDAEAEVERAPIDEVPVDLVADAGFDAFVRDNWEALSKGDPLSFHFLVPSRLDYMSFKVKLLRDEELEGRPVRVFRLALGGLLGLIVPGIDVTYDRDQRLLMRFEGLTNVRDAEGDNYVARIDFPITSRVSESTSTALDAAREAPLVSACSS